MKVYLKGLSILVAIFFTTTFNVSAQMAKAPSLNHIAVYVFDLKKSTDFYTNVIGLPVIPEPFHDGKHTWYKTGEHNQLHLIEGADGISEHNIHNHLCFSVSSMEEFIAVLNKNNVWFGNFLGEQNQVTTRPDGVKQIYFKDPDGYWIEINNDTY